MIKINKADNTVSYDVFYNLDVTTVSKNQIIHYFLPTQRSGIVRQNRTFTFEIDLFQIYIRFPYVPCVNLQFGSEGIIDKLFQLHCIRHTSNYNEIIKFFLQVVRKNVFSLMICNII